MESQLEYSPIQYRVHQLFWDNILNLLPESEIGRKLDLKYEHALNFQIFKIIHHYLGKIADQLKKIKPLCCRNFIYTVIFPQNLTIDQSMSNFLEKILTFKSRPFTFSH